MRAQGQAHGDVIFDHLFAVAPEFGLRVFQQPSGLDLAGALGRGGASQQDLPSQTS